MKVSNVLLFLLLLGGACVGLVRYDQLVNNEKRYVQQLGQLYFEKYKSILVDSIHAINFLEVSVTELSDTNPLEYFSALSSGIFRSNEHYLISYLPKGVVEYSYPEDKNREIQGHSFLEHTSTKDCAELTFSREKATFTMPYIGFKNEEIIFIHKPIFITTGSEKEFWGFVGIAVVHPFHLLREEEIWNLEKHNCEYKLVATYNDASITKHTTAEYLPNKLSAELDFELENAKWNLELYRKDAMLRINFYTAFVVIAYFAVAILLYYMFRRLEHRLNKTYINSLKDSLTKLSNKKGLFAYADETLQDKERGYTIFYLDLNLFKPVNDTYGHHIGDLLLIAFAERLKYQFKKNTFLCRNGGDEFIIIIPKLLQEFVCKKIVSRIVQIATLPFTIEGHRIEISASVGYASYPNDGQNFKDVLATADERMFEYKEANKCGR